MPEPRRNLDIELLRALVTIRSAGGFALAAEALNLTQSAISHQIRRLEGQVQSRLFYRQGRNMLLTNAGEQLASHAEKILELHDDAVRSMFRSHSDVVTLGLPEYYSSWLLPRILERFAKKHPTVLLDARTDRSEVLKHAIHERTLDLALVLQAPGKADGATVRYEPVVWFGAPTLDTLKKRPLPLVLFESPCVIRQMIINALDAARIPWEIAYTATTLESVSAAIKAKLGVTALPASAPLQPIKGWKTDGLPALPELECRLYSSSLNQPAPVSGLAEIITEELAELAEQAIQTSRRMLA